MQKILKLYTDAYRGLPLEIWLLSVVMLINRSGTMVLTFLALYLTGELGFSLTLAGQVLSLYGLGHLVGAWIGGWLVDRIGPLKIQFFALALSGLGYLVLEQMRSVGGLMFVTFLVATASESFRPANGTALTEFSPPELRTRAMALNRMALNLGFAVGPAVGGWLALRDYSLLFWVDGATCILAAILLWFIFRNRSAAFAEGRSEEQPETVLHPLRDRPFLLFLGLTVLFAICFFQGWSTYPIYLHDEYGFDEARFGLLMTLNAALILIFEMVLTQRIERHRPLRVVGWGSLLVGLGMAVLPLGNTVLLAVVSMTILTFGEMLVAPSAGGWVANRSHASHRGKYMGLYTMAWGLAFIIAPSAGTWTYQHLGGTVLWTAVGGIGVVVLVGCELLLRIIRRAPVGGAVASPLAG